MVCVRGVDEKLYAECQKKDDFAEAYFSNDQWCNYQQYEPALQPLKDFSQFCQSSKVIVQWELFEAHRALEDLSAQYFTMYENMSMRGQFTDRMECDLTKRDLKHLVIAADFAWPVKLPESEYVQKFKGLEENEMYESIQLARQLAWRNLALRLGFVARTNTIS